MRNFVILLVVLALGVGAWFLLRDDGLVEQVTAERIEQALLDNRVPPEMASCMGPRLADRLSLNQLRKLERAAPQSGESREPLSTTEALSRFRRIGDDEVLEQVVRVAGGCGLEIGLNILRL